MELLLRHERMRLVSLRGKLKKEEEFSNVGPFDLVKELFMVYL